MTTAISYQATIFCPNTIQVPHSGCHLQRKDVNERSWWTGDVVGDLRFLSVGYFRCWQFRTRTLPILSNGFQTMSRCSIEKAPISIEFWNEKKIMWSRWPSVTSLLAGFPWLQHLLATPLPYRCHQFNVIPFLRNLMTPFIKLCFRKSSREFRSSSQQCSAGRLFCTGIQVNRIVQCTTRMEKKSTRFFRGGNGWDGIHGSREQHERFGNSFLKEWKQQISPFNV